MASRHARKASCPAHFESSSYCRDSPRLTPGSERLRPNSSRLASSPRPTERAFYSPLRYQQVPTCENLCPVDLITSALKDDVLLYYDLVDGGVCLGEGSYGSVRLLQRISDGEKVACKSVLKKRLRRLDHVLAIQREVEVMQMLKGTGGDSASGDCRAEDRILKLIEAYEDEDAIHLLLEYCIGGDMMRHISLRGPMPEPLAAYLFCHVATAVWFCGRNNIIHRDVKPDNILLLRPLPTPVCDLWPDMTPVRLLQAEAERDALRLAEEKLMKSELKKVPYHGILLPPQPPTPLSQPTSAVSERPSALSAIANHLGKGLPHLQSLRECRNSESRNSPRGGGRRGTVLSPTLVSEAMETSGGRENEGEGTPVDTCSPEIEGKGDEFVTGSKTETSKGIDDVDVRNEDQVQCTVTETFDTSQSGPKSQPKSTHSTSPLLPATCPPDPSAMWRVLADPSLDPITLKLADFGFATELPPGGSVFGVVGTTEYVAPEVCTARTYNCKADVWSLGVTLYVMLGGYYPFGHCRSKTGAGGVAGGRAGVGAGGMAGAAVGAGVGPGVGAGAGGVEGIEVGAGGGRGTGGGGGSGGRETDGGEEERIFHSIVRGDFEMTRPPWPSVSEDAKDLIRQMLTVHRHERVTAGGVLRHPWVHAALDQIPPSRQPSMRPSHSRIGSSTSQNSFSGSESSTPTPGRRAFYRRMPSEDSVSSAGGGEWGAACYSPRSPHMPIRPPPPVHKIRSPSRQQ